MRNFVRPVGYPVEWAWIVDVEKDRGGHSWARLDCGHRQQINKTIRLCIFWNGLPWGISCRQCSKRRTV